MISPNYIWATGIPIFKLEHPVGLQLACVGSKSTINYGVKSSIVFRNKHIEEYFDMANIDHYDVILGMPFLQQLWITLDFTGQGASQDFRSDVNRVFEKSRSEISSPITCNLCCRLHSLQICSSMFSPSWENIQKISCCILIILIGLLASKIVMRASHTPLDVDVLYSSLICRYIAAYAC